MCQALEGPKGTYHIILPQYINEIEQVYDSPVCAKKEMLQ
jgi:hypothetical protein